MKSASSRHNSQFDRIKKGVDKKFAAMERDDREDHDDDDDRDDDDAPGWLTLPFGDARPPAHSSSHKHGKNDTSGFPTDVAAIEDEASVIDLSGVNLKKLGKNNDFLTFEIAASEGILEAISSKKVTVSGSGTDTLQLTGKRVHLDKFLDDTMAITYTSAKDDFGDNAAVLTLSTSKNGTVTTLPSINVDIADVTDDQIGTPQDDTLTGDNGRNTLLGLGANDVLVGLAGDDSINGSGGNDTIIGGAGADTLEGGADSDVLQYVGSPAGVVVDLNEDAAGFQHASGGHAQGDVISGFENVYATDFVDVLTGNEGRNILFGYGGDDSIDGNGGDDVIRGSEGADTLSGGDGVDWIRYLGASSGVTVDLNADAAGFQSASRGEAQGDVISGFENVYGSEFADVITGDQGNNYILGYGGGDTIESGAGNDTIRGGNGADTLDGGAGTDLLQYTGSTAGVTIDLNADASGFQQASGGDAEGDVISGFENVYATNADDSLVGNNARNILYGYAGDDTIDGGDGKDVLRGFAGADTFVFSTALGAGNFDRIVDFEAGNDVIQLNSSVFTGLASGELDATQFLINNTGLAENATDRIIYNTDSGHIYFDSDGVGGADGVRFATVSTGLALDETDFFVL